jgi:hypothetical protein
MAQDRDQRRALVNTVIKTEFHKRRTRSQLVEWFSRRTLFHGVSLLLADGIR